MVDLSSDEDDGDEDGGDQDEWDDNEEQENEDDGIYHNNKTCATSTGAMKGILNSQTPSHKISGKGFQIPESTFTSWNTWVAENMKSNNVLDLKLQPLPTEGLSSSQFHTTRESSFFNVPESRTVDTIVPKPLYGKFTSNSLAQVTSPQ